VALYTLNRDCFSLDSSDIKEKMYAKKEIATNPIFATLETKLQTSSSIKAHSTKLGWTTKKYNFHGILNSSLLIQKYCS